MRSRSHSWTNTLTKLGFTRKRRKNRTKGGFGKRLSVEGLEERRVLTELFFMGEETSNCPDECPCDCAQVGTTKSNTATTNAGLLQYNSGTQAHPMLTFGFNAASFDPNNSYGHHATLLKAELTIGNNDPIVAYFGEASQGVIDSGGWSVFGFQLDASEIPSGVYNWELVVSLYDEDDPSHQYPNHYYTRTFTSAGNIPTQRPLEIVNQDFSQYGQGWSMLNDTRLVIQENLPGQPNGVALVTGNNEVTWYYDPSYNGVYTRGYNPTNFSGLQKHDNGTSLVTDDTYLLTDPNGTVTTFDYQGLLQTVVDRNGNFLATYTYGTGSDWDKIVEIENQAGRITHFQYDGDLLTEVTDFYGTTGAQTTQYEYHTGTNRLKRMIEPDPDGAGPLTSPVTTYGYNSDHLLESVIDPRGLETTVSYDQFRRVSSITERCGGVINITSLQSQAIVGEIYDPLDNPPDEQDRDVLYPWLTYGANAPFQNAETIFSSGIYETRDVFGEETKIIRDLFGNIYFERDASGTTTRVSKDGNGLPSSVDLPDPNTSTGTLTTAYYFDANSGQLRSIVHPTGTEFQTWNYGAFGQVSSYEDAEHYTWYDIDPSNGNVSIATQKIGQDDRYSSETNDLKTYYTYTNAQDGTLLGLLETVTDPNGNVTRYTYNNRGLVETVTYAEGTADETTVEYEYDARDRLSAMIDGREARTEYTYDNLDRLIQRTDPDPVTKTITSASPVWKYRYDRNSNLTHVTDPLGNVTESVYDERNRPFQVIQPLASGTGPIRPKDDHQYSAATGTWSTSSQAGAYGGNIRTSSTTGASTTYTISPLQKTLKFDVQIRWVPSSNPDAYDKNALVEVFAGSTATGTPLTTFRVDLNSLPEGIPDSSGMMWLSLGAFTAVGSGTSGALTVKISDDDGNGLLVVDAVRAVGVGPVTQTEYDCSGNLVKVIDPIGSITEYQYDDLDRLIARKDPDPATGTITANSPVTRYTYNALGWLTSMSGPNGNGALYEYDSMGRRTKELQTSSPGLLGEYRAWHGELLHTRIDAELNFSASSNFAGFSDLGDGFWPTWTGAIYLDFGTESSGEATFYLNNTDYARLYVDGQEVVRNENQNAGVMTEEYATLELSAGLHTFVVEFDDQSDQGPSGLIVSYDIGNGKEVISNDVLFTTESTITGYDDVGRVTGITDPLGNTTSYTYDDVDRLLTETIEVGYETLTRSYEYITGDNKVRKTDRNGRVTEYEYDHLNRLKAEVWYDGVTPIRTIDYGYDGSGNLTLVSDPTATYGYEYDYLNRRIETALNIAGLTSGVDFAYGYDAASRMTSTSAAIGGTADYLNNYLYNRLGEVTRITQDGVSGGNDLLYKYVSLGYNAAGQLITGVTRTGDEGYAGTTYAYDKAGRLTQIDHESLNFGGPSSRVAFAETHTYTYDAGGRVATYTNSAGGVDATYSYDTTDQLTGADYTTLADEAYAYDANGNRTSGTAGSSSSVYEIGPHNRLLADGTYRYEYDGEGNRTRRYVDDDLSGTFTTGDTDVTEYTWDYRNRLVTVASYDEYEGDLTQQVDFAYDAANQLVKRVVDPDGETGSDPVEQTFYVHDRGQVVLQFDKSGAGSVAAGDLSHRYLWGPVVDQLFGDERVKSLSSAGQNELFWALTDRQGSVTALVDDATGGLRLHRTFDSFGNITGETHYGADAYGYSYVVTENDLEYVDEAFAYTGRLLDQATGLQNNLNRWYDASVGRWLSEDPIGFNAGDANLYRYVGNGPVNATDPSGLDPWNAMPGTPHPFTECEPVQPPDWGHLLPNVTLGIGLTADAYLLGVPGIGFGSGFVDVEIQANFFINPQTGQSTGSLGFQGGPGGGFGGGIGLGLSVSPNGDVDTVAHGEYCYAELDTPWADLGLSWTHAFTLYTLDIGIFGNDIGISAGNGFAF